MSQLLKKHINSYISHVTALKITLSGFLVFNKFLKLYLFFLYNNYTLTSNTEKQVNLIQVFSIFPGGLSMISTMNTIEQPATEVTTGCNTHGGVNNV
jgi:hypothetical protein